MSYTTVSQVAGMFPTFKRGTPQQSPTDALIQTYIDDSAGEIDAVLDRRFGEAIESAPYNESLAAWIAALSPDAQNVLERINRMGRLPNSVRLWPVSVWRLPASWRRIATADTTNS